MEKSMVTIAKYRDLNEAMLMKSLLEGHGIPAFLPDENAASLGNQLIWEALTEVRLQVPEADVDRARECLNRAEVIRNENPSVQPPDPETVRRRKLRRYFVAGILIFTAVCLLGPCAFSKAHKNVVRQPPHHSSGVAAEKRNYVWCPKNHYRVLLTAVITTMRNPH